MRSKKQISLYQCFNAKVCGEEIKCSKGYWLGPRKAGVPVNMLKRGAPLEITTCQQCQDFDSMGEPVLREDRGWL